MDANVFTTPSDETAELGKEQAFREAEAAVCRLDYSLRVRGGVSGDDKVDGDIRTILDAFPLLRQLVTDQQQKIEQYETALDATTAMIYEIRPRADQPISEVDRLEQLVADKDTAIKLYEKDVDRMEWLSHRMGSLDATAWQAIGLDPQRLSLEEAIDAAMEGSRDA